MNLRQLTDDAVLSSTERAVQTERDAISNTLHHFLEVDRRRLYSKLKFKSLKDYIVGHLKYSESEAWFRISAMQLLKELPEIEPQINDGSLQLSNLVLARRAFSQETHQSKEAETPARAKEEKLAVIKRLENVSKSEALKILKEETGMVVTATESWRELSDGKVEVKTVLTEEAASLANELKGLLAHSHPQISNGELIELALKALKREIDPTEKAKRAQAKITVPEQSQSVASGRYIPATVRHHVWMRDAGKCTNCGSNHAVQYEHIVPFALGGKSTIENVKLLCRNCNQRTAIESFGVSKMQKYLSEPSREYVIGTGALMIRH
ncbi:MAG TPA: HNH endonuclease signature motif containing protein [Bdellovibrionales bacterium]|nr:HNH endonuclease signature motif containing protein [Bdellovibrionales bacterium]